MHEPLFTLRLLTFIIERSRCSGTYGANRPMPVWISRRLGRSELGHYGSPINRRSRSLVAGQTDLRCAVDLVEIEKVAVVAQRVGNALGGQPRNTPVVIGANLLDPLWAR